MSSVPEERSGVASGVNNIARQVGGALGVAIVGSIVDVSIYAARLDAPASVPRPARDAAESRSPAAHAVGPARPGAVGGALVARPTTP